ncbi:hypothetical protein DPSP01_010401 [Paraphaeosphaeria sporulosa]
MEDCDPLDVEVSEAENVNAKKDKGTGPACQPCRTRKSKCSRQMPCSQCVKNELTCVYDKEKNKPGMKVGAIDRINRRLDALENMFLGQGLLWQRLWNHVQNTDSQATSSSPLRDALCDQTDQLKQNLDALGRKRCSGNSEALGLSIAHKRQRTSAEDDSVSPASRSDTTESGYKLPTELVDSLVDLYFVHIHPWIPILHVRQFRGKMRIEAERKKLGIILRAITATCIRFSNDPRLGDLESRSKLAKSNHQAVILESMESFSVEGLQALIICAFDTIGSGRGPSSWSIVGSMARTVEQLQLSIEEDADGADSLSRRDTHALVKRIAFLRPCQTWSEAEERRRVFWNVFLMDRFCSIATGWNVCLTSADVKRRLPCEGALWGEGRPLETPTPFFGVSDPPGTTVNSLPTARLESADQASLGGFAYCIEATESLSLVTSFFLQQAVDVARAHDLQVWLMRFKQLDLRLVQWKIFLPERWREACALNADGNMDPNLTLAHITHNTAVVLLHQGIAYPPQEWQLIPMKLPTSSSAETCMAASVEVSIIAEQFLLNTQCLTNPQFAFCLFICGRMLLAHSFYYEIPLPPAFNSLVQSLKVMAQRWNGEYSTLKTNLASKFAIRLVHARKSGLQTLDLRQAAYSDNPPDLDVNASSGTLASTEGLFNGTGTGSHALDSMSEAFPMTIDQVETPDSITLAFPPLPLAFQAQSSSKNQTAMSSPTLESTKQASFAHAHAGFAQDSALEDLASFLDYPFLPDQRVSTFSHSMG